MASGKVRLDGETYAWAPVAGTRRVVLAVSWLRDADPDLRVEIGRIRKSDLGAGWTVHPRVGGLRRAQESAKDLATSRPQAILFLVDLARAEVALTAAERTRLGLSGEGDALPAHEPLPVAAAA